ncbi:hypothetical protein DFJ74DRAFT_687696 [Hyaloraphidium curvatum]|nr:hypothetical protein DFJ74DRAFT_687696 [Hyaloraphidium curvatum]
MPEVWFCSRGSAPPPPATRRPLAGLEAKSEHPKLPRKQGKLRVFVTVLQLSFNVDGCLHYQHFVASMKAPQHSEYIRVAARACRLAGRDSGILEPLNLRELFLLRDVEARITVALEDFHSHQVRSLAVLFHHVRRLVQLVWSKPLVHLDQPLLGVDGREGGPRDPRHGVVPQRARLDACRSLGHHPHRGQHPEVLDESEQLVAGRRRRVPLHLLEPLVNLLDLFCLGFVQLLPPPLFQDLLATRQVHGGGPLFLVQASLLLFFRPLGLPVQVPALVALPSSGRRGRRLVLGNIAITRSTEKDQRPRRERHLRLHAQ